MFEFLDISNIIGQDPVSFIQDQIKNNQMFVALLGVMIFGSVMYVLRGLPKLLGKLILSRFTCVLSVPNSTLDYAEVVSYLSKNGYINSKIRRLETVYHFHQENMKQNPFDQNTNSHIGVGLGQGYHLIYHKGTLLIIHHHINNDSKMRDKPKTLTIRVIGRTNDKIKSFLHDVSEFKEQVNKNYMPIEIKGSYSDFNSMAPKRNRDTLILDDSISKDIFDDIDWFLRNRQWYVDRGIPYKRGYLFYGPPGTGKTSLVKAICTHLNSKIMIINLNSISNDNELLKMFCSIEAGSIILLEDVDAIKLDINQRGEKNKSRSNNKVNDNNDDDVEEGSGVTLSGILNALDGVANSDSIITIMTTNYPEKIDNAMIRPGRVDKKVYIGYPNYESCRKFFDMFYESYRNNEQLKDKFASACVDNMLSPADIQEVCIENITNPQEAIETINSKENKQLQSFSIKNTQKG